MSKPPKELEEAKFPEPFPGFEEATKSVTRDVRAAEKQMQEAEGRLAAHEKGKWGWAGIPFVLWRTAKTDEEVAEIIAQGKGPFWVKAWEAEQERLLSERQEATRQLGRVTWFDNFYKIAPELIKSGIISSYEDYLERMKSDPTGILSEEDIELVRERISKMSGARPVTAREDAPDWLQITPEQESAVRKAFALEPKPANSIHAITVNQLVKSLTMRPKITLPEEWTAEDMLKFASIMDIPEEELRRAVDITELLEPYSSAIVEQEARIKSILAGEDEWQIPEMALWQRALFTVFSPFQTVADVIRPYLENFSYPWTGAVAYGVSRFLSGGWEIEEQYAKFKSQGYNWWDAMSEAYQDWTLPWYLKLPMEILLDPLTYTPGLVLKVPGTLLSKIPTVATRSLGQGFLAWNKGLWYALDLPFDGFKTMWVALPKTFNQATRMELNSFRDLLVAATSKQSSHVVSDLTVDDLTKTLEKAMKDFAADPSKQGDVFVDLGSELVKHAPLDEKATRIWARSLGQQIDEVTPKMLADVEDVISDAVLKMGSPAENAKRIAMALSIEDTPKNLGKLIKDIGVITSKYTNRVPRAIEIGRQAKVNPTLQMTEYLVATQKSIIEATERSAYAKGKVLEGITLALMNKVNTLERGVWRLTLDRWLVRPFAEAYLGSVAYPIWNVFEGIGVSILEGVVPHQAKQEAFQRMFLGIRGVDNRVMQWSASDVAGLLGTMPGREGAISLLPGKIPEKILGLKTHKWLAGKDYLEWTGRKWIELSDVWGTGLRANFLIRKMANYLAEYSYEVAGHDLNVAFHRLITRTYPKNAIARKSLGLNDFELKQEMYSRATTGLKSEVLGMHDFVSNSKLMQGEALKILREATELSPQARTLGEQMIARGEFKTLDEVTSFAKTLADQSIADLRAYPSQAPATFRFIADQIEDIAQKEVNTTADLMQIFQHYEIMADTASHVPMRLLSQVMEESDELKRLNQFGKLESLWRTSRAEVETITDEIAESLNRVKAVLQSKSSLLNSKQQNAMNALLERQTARLALQEQFLKFDGRLLDDFWALPKAARTGEEHTALRAYRWENIIKYKDEDAVLGAGDFLERKSYSQLYHQLPKPRLIRVDASNRALAADDAAKVMGANVDALTTGLMESMTFQDKPYFIQMIKQAADAHPTYYKGFTEDKIGQLYDDILRGIKMNPEADIATQKILQQAEGVKQKMILLRMNKSVSPAEEKALHEWVDDVAAGMDEIVGKKGIISAEQWSEVRQKASESAHKEYYKAFADYTNENIIDAVGKSIFPFWCVPEYVPVLTRRGWKHYSQLQIGEDILTVNPDTLITEWQPVQEFAEFDYDDKLMVIPAKGKDIEFTSEHRWLVINKHQNTSQVKRGYQLSDNYDLIPRALPHKFPSKSILSVRDARILGWLVTDGHISKYQSLIYQSYEKYLIEIMELVGAKATYNKDKTFKVHVPQKDMKRILTVCPTKEDLPRVITELSEDAAKAMWDAMLKAEGNCYTAYTGSENWSFKQNPGAVMEAFQMLSVLCGKAITTTENRVNILCNRKPYQSKEVRRLTTRHYKGKVWCPVTANGTWFANFNGCVLPTGNTYHLYRPFFLTRTFIRKPGTAAAWGRYYEYSDYGYQHIPGTDLEFSPAVGSVFGATFGLARHDFKTYYENLGWMGEVLDFTQRLGFFPGIHYTLPISLTSILSDRAPELGNVLAPIHRSGLNTLVGSKIPGVSDSAKWLKERVFHENFNDYYTATIVSSKQVAAGGSLIGGQAGVDLWFKKMRGEKLTDDEQQLWDSASEEAAWIETLRSQFPSFRLRAEEMLTAYEQVVSLIEAQTGMTAKMQDDLWKHNLRPTHVIGGLPLELRTALDQMWQWRIYFGRGAILMAPEYSDLFNKVDSFYDKVERFQMERLAAQTDTNAGFLTPTRTLHFDGGEWRREYAKNWSAYVSRVESLESDPEFADVIDALTPEGQIRLAKELGFTPPPIDPMQEAIRLYFDIEMHKKIDPYTGEEDDDYLRFWLERESVRMVLPENQREAFDAYIRRYQTPMEVLFKEVTNKYLKGYQAISRIVLEEFTDEEKALIAEFYATTTTLDRKKEIQEFTSHSGKQLISYWDSRRTNVRQALRRASPELDFWLHIFGYTTPLTDAAKEMVRAWEQDRTSIVKGITETSMLEDILKKVEEKKLKEAK